LPVEGRFGPVYESIEGLYIRRGDGKSQVSIITSAQSAPQVRIVKQWPAQIDQANRNGILSMDWMEDLMRNVPAASPFRAQLEKMAAEHARLSQENTDLKIQLSRHIEQWETLDGDAVKTLQHLAGEAFENADAIARAHKMNFQITDSYLKFLVRHAYVVAPGASAQKSYGLTSKGRRYLQERGLLE
jgi:regulator of replication initiation timing